MSANPKPQPVCDFCREALKAVEYGICDACRAEIMHDLAIWEEMQHERAQHDHRCRCATCGRE